MAYLSEYMRRSIDALPVLATVNGIPIHFRESDQKFVAIIGSRVMARADLNSIKRACHGSHVAAPIYAMEVSTSSSTAVLVRELVGNEQGRWRHKNGSLDRYARTYYRHDPDLIKRFDDINHRAQLAREAFEVEWKAARLELVVVTPADFQPAEPVDEEVE